MKSQNATATSIYPIFSLERNRGGSWVTGMRERAAGQSPPKAVPAALSVFHLYSPIYFMFGHLHPNTQDMNCKSCHLLKHDSEPLVSTQGPEAGDASQTQQVKNYSEYFFNFLSSIFTPFFSFFIYGFNIPIFKV